MAADGIQLVAVSRITLRANIERLVGGAGEDTILARVGEGIVTTIGSAQTHKQVLENPDRISQMVMTKGLDAGTAFEILSIDIADVDVGANIGAKLQIDQAEADKSIAQAQADHDARWLLPRAGEPCAVPRSAREGPRRPRPRSRSPWPKRFVPVTSASWTTTTSRMWSQTPRCVVSSAAPTPTTTPDRVVR